VIEAEFTLPWSCSIDYFVSKNGLVKTWVMYGLPDPPGWFWIWPDRLCRFRGKTDPTQDDDLDFTHSGTL